MVAGIRRSLAEETEEYEYMKDKINIKNVIVFYQLASIFNSETLSQVAFDFIERFFTMVVKTKSFLELDYIYLAKLVVSSVMCKSLELEVFNAAEKWLTYKTKERVKFAKDLLLKLRLHLLTDNTLNNLLTKSSLFYKTDEGLQIFKEVLYSKDNSIRIKSNPNFTNLYSYKRRCNIVVCGGYDKTSKKVVRNFSQIDGNDFNSVKVLPPMIEGRGFFNSVCLKNDVYVFGGLHNVCNYRMITSVEKYSPITNAWKVVASIYDARRLYCTCGYEDRIYLFGGNYHIAPNPMTAISSCLQFDATNYEWKEIARMKQERTSAACAIFNGKIVVAGGTDSDFLNILNTVESYDVSADKWSPMPNMVNGKDDHSLVVVKNKLFVFGTGTHTFEVFDNYSQKFATLKSPQLKMMFVMKAISIGNIINIFQSEHPYVICYDVDRDEWCEKSCEITDNLTWYSCVKVPWFLETVLTN